MFNNTKRNTIYSIRKGVMGTASVTIGTCLLLGMSNQASAVSRFMIKILIFEGGAYGSTCA